MNRSQIEKFKQALGKVFENDEGRWDRDKRIKAEEAAKQAEQQRKAKEQQDRVKGWGSQDFMSDEDRAKKGLPPAESTPPPQAPNPKLSPSGSYLETNPKFDFKKAGQDLAAKDAAEKARKEAADKAWMQDQDAKAAKREKQDRQDVFKWRMKQLGTEDRPGSYYGETNPNER